MAKKEPKRLPRGFWDSSEGRMELNKVRRKEITPQELADKYNTTVPAVYNAMSKRSIQQAPVPIAVDPDLDRLLASVETFLGDAVSSRLKAMQRQLAEVTVRAEVAERELEVYRNRAADREAMVERLQRRVGEKVARVMEGPTEVQS